MHSKKLSGVKNVDGSTTLLMLREGVRQIYVAAPTQQKIYITEIKTAQDWATTPFFS